MVHNHDHAGVKWGGGERGAKYAEGGRNSVRPPPSCATAKNVNHLNISNKSYDLKKPNPKIQNNFKNSNIYC